MDEACATVVLLMGSVIFVFSLRCGVLVIGGCWCSCSDVSKDIGLQSSLAPFSFWKI